MRDPFLLPNREGTLCILPGASILAATTFSPGPAGLREPYDLISRVQSFGRYVFSPTSTPRWRRSSTRRARRARALDRPAHKQHLDPFEFNLIVQLGQTVAAHLDGVYFWGATRFQLPQWLLAHGLLGRFADRFVDQVQVVAYLHEWGPATRRGGKAGQFCMGDGRGGRRVAVPTPRKRS